MSKRDYYEVLGVSKTATDDEIKKAYRNLAKKYHPDVSTEANAEEKFKEVNEANDVLSDPQKRKQYDQFGHADPSQFGQGGGGFSGFGGFSDIFESFFGGGMNRQGRSGGGNNRRQGNDLEQQITIDFLEAIHGCKKTLKVTLDDECGTCGGTGAYSKSDIHVCERCHGTGSVVVEQQSIFGRVQTQTTCPKCGGRGQEITKKCEKCSGKGRIRLTKDINITIPAGIADGMSMRLEGKGEAGYNGGVNGDLYILVKVRPHKIFTREDDDILSSIEITFSQAALGSEASIETVGDPVTIKIPAGIQSNTKIRLKGKGVKNVRSNSFGDHYLTVIVKTPTNLTLEEKAIFEQLGNITPKGKDSNWSKVKKKFKN